MNTVYLTSQPRLYSSYLGALLKRNRYRQGEGLPHLSYQWDGLRFAQPKLQAYQQACALDKTDSVPLFYPHAVLGGLHLILMTHADFPLTPLGAVHCRNHVLQLAPLSLGRSYCATLKLVAQRMRPQGLEFDLLTRLRSDEGELCWTSVSSYLVRLKLDQEEEPSALSRQITNLTHHAQLAKFDVPPGIGREYGRVTGDINPIHMSALLARAFGFRKDLAHGMWSVARGLDFFNHLDSKLPIRHDVAFKGPLYLGESVDVKQSPEQLGAFEYYGAHNERPSVVGLVRNVATSETLV